MVVKQGKLATFPCFSPTGLISICTASVQLAMEELQEPKLEPIVSTSKKRGNRELSSLEAEPDQRVIKPPFVS